MPAISNVTKLCHLRSQLISTRTRISTFVEEFDIESKDLFGLKSRLDCLEKIYKEFSDIELDIEYILLGKTEDENELIVCDAIRVTFENEFFRLKSAMLAHIQTLEAVPVAQPLPGTPAGVDSSDSRLKLPTINLPTFNGKFENWLTFHDTYTSLIHENKSLSPMQKFHYLRSALVENAAHAISSVETSNDNYEVAWKLICSRYQNKRLIVKKHIEVLFNLKVIAKESSKDLRFLSDSVMTQINILKKLGLPTEHWDAIIVWLLSSKFDSVTRREWECEKDLPDFPTITSILDFLQRKCEMLESIESRQVCSSAVTTPKLKQSSSTSAMKRTTALVSPSKPSSVTTSPLKCAFCQQRHPIYRCNQFLNKSSSERRTEVKRLALCFNCLRADHQREQCKTTFKCQICCQLHHTLLHLDEPSVLKPTYSPQNLKSPHPSSSQATISQVSNNYTVYNQSQIYLSTAIVHVEGANAEVIPCRVLLDSGSQSNFITEEMCQLIQLKKRRIADLPVHGISQSQTIVTHEVSATVKSRFVNFSACLDFLVLPKITGHLPSKYVLPEKFMIPENLNLADPMFHKPAKIDILIGAELFYEILCTSGQIQISEGLPILQETKFGWIVSGKMFDAAGPTLDPQSYFTHSYSCLSFSSLDNQLKKFWEIEDCQSHSNQSLEEKLCEDEFKRTIKRNASGRYIVTLPCKSNILDLGDSYKMALSRFLLLERRFKRQPELKESYTSFIDDYYLLDHMEEVSDLNNSTNKVFYLPHHPVIKPTSSTTKLRVVFDASAKTSSGLSLNSVLMVGPTVQDDLFSIILRFRLHKYVLAADITKMYRQILVQPDQTHLQRILWRNSPDENIKTFNLKTVTYGTSCAPYLATRCLKQIAIEKSLESPNAAAIIGRDFYVDDLMTGSDDFDEAQRLQGEIIDILKGYGFDLHKWYSNEDKLLCNIPFEKRESNSSLQIDDSETVKTLGLLFQPKTDRFRFSIKLKNLDKKITKRTILSEIASIFDPLGLVGPIITTAKILMQNLWQIKVDWDDTIPDDYVTRWVQFRNQLHNLNDVSIQRWVVPCTEKKYIELHGFCDASQDAYGACIYLISTDINGSRSSNLLCSKARVAPVKTITIPKLELCGALLLAQLTEKVCGSLKIQISSLNFWTDSTIVLAWLRGNPSDWKVFVGNRVSQIQEITKTGTWKHVKTEDNPADYISRGLPVNQLLNQDAWWHGPAWLLDDPTTFKQNYQDDNLLIPESRIKTVATVIVDSDFNLLTKFSSFKKLQRVVAYCFRFINNVKRPDEACYGDFTTTELNTSLQAIIRLSQCKSFATELKELQQGKQVNTKSKLLTLNPFLENDIIRVGGRLENSQLYEGQRHPVVLSQNCHFTKLLMNHSHLKNLHAGPQALLAFVRQEYWPLNGRSLAKETVRKCIRCFKSKPVFMKQIMASLPPHRVQPSRPFINTGVDYGGPFFIKRTPRGGTKVKAYLALFICTATKAIHLELVSELTTNAFIAALNRFMGRRGKCSNLFSDNATNFVGANRELKELKELFLSEEHQHKIKKMLAEDNITWHFIPPRSPHFGGLWEAGIKSAKHHLKRILGQTLLTFEEFNTIIIQIEAILNSRPISPLSSDPSDLKYLTPGHFLIGEALNSTIDPDLTTLQMNRLSRWQRIQQISQQFWRRWSMEYLSQLQQRNKWTTNQSNIKIGTLVLIKDDNLPSRFWLIGRVTELHPGSDGKVRVVSLKTSTGVFKRSVNNLCQLPIEEDIIGSLPDPI